MALLQTSNGAGASPRVKQYAGGYGGALDSWVLGTTAVISAVFLGASSYARRNTDSAIAGASTGSASANGFTIGKIGSTTTLLANITWSQTLIRSVADDTALSTRIIRYFMRLGGIS